MSIEKTNIAVLAWRYVARPLASSADLLSWVLFSCFFLIFFFAIFVQFIESGELWALYVEGYAALLYGAWALLVLSTLGPIFNIARARKEVPLGILVGVGIIHLLAFILIGVMVLSKSENPSAITALLAAFAAAMTVGIGWIVQNQIAAKASRRAHTFGVFVQSRLSKEFQDQVRARVNYYHQGRPIESDDVFLFQKSGFDIRLEELAKELGREISGAKSDEREAIYGAYEEKRKILVAKYESMQGVKYILNFYEFVCAGILLKEIDEPMISETLGDIAIGLYQDTMHVRIYAKTLQPKAYSNFESVVENYWLNKGGVGK